MENIHSNKKGMTITVSSARKQAVWDIPLLLWFPYSFISVFSASVGAAAMMKHVLGQYYPPSGKYVASFTEVQEADTFQTDH